MKLSLHAPRVPDLEPVLATARLDRHSMDPPFAFDHAPHGFRLGQTRERVGSGAADYDRARDVVRAWVFLPAWARVHPEAAPQMPGDTVVIAARTMGVWTFLPARIVEEIDDNPRRSGFVYAALPRHVAQGYERFVVEHDDATGDVTFDITAVARPTSPPLRLLRPVFSAIQRHFRRACMNSMRAELQKRRERTPPEGSAS